MYKRQHIGCIGTAHAVELGRAAQQLGYDAVSSVTPFYYGFTTDEIKQYYFDIADAVDLPMLVYNIPSKSGVTMRVQDLSELLCDSRMLGVKYTSNDFFALEQVKTAHPDKLVYLSLIHI